MWYWGVILWWELANETERLSSLKFLGKMPNRDRGFPRVGVGWFSRVRFARSTIPVEKIGTTHSLFLLRHLLAVKRLFWWKNFLLNKEHSRPFEQCWPLRDHLVLCESSSALQTFYHMKNNWWRLLKTLETPKDGVENVLSFEIYVRLYHVQYIRALDSRKWLINQSSFGESKTNNT